MENKNKDVESGDKDPLHDVAIDNISNDVEVEVTAKDDVQAHSAAQGEEPLSDGLDDNIEVKSMPKVEISSKARSAGFNLMLGVALIIIVLFALTGNDSTSKDTSTPNQETDEDAVNYDESVKARFKENQGGAPSQQSYTESNNSPPNHDESDKANAAIEEIRRQGKLAFDKAMVERMNAPSSMYSSEKVNDDVLTVNIKAKYLKHPESTLAQSEIISATLETAITSELAGQVRAIVSQPVYAYTGNKVLIPRGSRLLGEYTQAVFQGQSRVAIIWNRVLLPNGISADIDSQSTDNLGRAGQGASYVDSHYFERFSQAVMLSVISAGAATLNISDTDDFNAKQAYRAGASRALADQASEVLEENSGIKPTLYVKQGVTLKVMLQRDIDFNGIFRKAAKGQKHG